MTANVNLPPFDTSRPSLRRLADAFGRVPLRLVGGAVRDASMARPVLEIDLATPAPPEQVITLLEAAGIRAVPTGIDHGTVTAVVDGEPYEITTLRRDEACDGRHAEVTFTDDWAQDARRRDFTMNALYAELDGTRYDPLGQGVADANSGHVRFIGDAHERIREDGLRILRFFRFHATHGKGELDAEGLSAAITLRDMLHDLSGERIQQEMLKLLRSNAPWDVLEAMRSGGILRAIGVQDLSPLTDSLPSAETHMAKAPDALLRLAAMLRGNDTAKLASRWKLSRRDSDRLTYLAQAPLLYAAANEATIREYLRQHGEERHAMLTLSLAATPDASWREKAADYLNWLLPVFPVTGKDLLRSMEPGPRFGETLQKLEQRWVESGYMASREELLATV